MRMIATIAVLLFAAPAASAADSFYAKYIAERNGVAPCYARTYDQKHLAAHPKQKVVHFFVTHSDDEQPDAAEVVRPRLRLPAQGLDRFLLERGGLRRDRATGRTARSRATAGTSSLTPGPTACWSPSSSGSQLEGMESFSPDLMKSDDREFRLYVSPAGDCCYGWRRGRRKAAKDEAAVEPLAPSIQRPG